MVLFVDYKLVRCQQFDSNSTESCRLVWRRNSERRLSLVKLFYYQLRTKIELLPLICCAVVPPRWYKRYVRTDEPANLLQRMTNIHYKN